MYIIYNYYNYKHRRILQRYIILIYDTISSNVSANLRSRSAYTIYTIYYYCDLSLYSDDNNTWYHIYMMLERCCA